MAIPLLLTMVASGLLGQPPGDRASASEDDEGDEPASAAACVPPAGR
jgi:hypothetical protein